MTDNNDLALQIINLIKTNHYKHQNHNLKQTSDSLTIAENLQTICAVTDNGDNEKLALQIINFVKTGLTNLNQTEKQISSYSMTTAGDPETMASTSNNSTINHNSLQQRFVFDDSEQSIDESSPPSGFRTCGFNIELTLGLTPDSINTGSGVAIGGDGQLEITSNGGSTSGGGGRDTGDGVAVGYRKGGKGFENIFSDPSLFKPSYFSPSTFKLIANDPPEFVQYDQHVFDSPKGNQLLPTNQAVQNNITQNSSFTKMTQNISNKPIIEEKFFGKANMAKTGEQIDKPWIFDCGATDTMTFELSDMISKSKPKIDHIKTANGGIVPVKGGGTIEISPTLRLSNCLYVPSLSHKLLSISHVTKELNCSLLMHPTFCILQDIRTGVIIGRGTER